MRRKNKELPSIFSTKKWFDTNEKK